MADRGMLPDHENRFFCKAGLFTGRDRIRAHFLICFLALTIYRYLEKKLDLKYTCEELLETLKGMNFANTGTGIHPII